MERPTFKVHAKVTYVTCNETRIIPMAGVTLGVDDDFFEGYIT